MNVLHLLVAFLLRAMSTIFVEILFLDTTYNPTNNVYFLFWKYVR